LDCEVSSREYQVVLRTDLFVNSFASGVKQVIDELAMIEDTDTMAFKVSRSSLKFKNVTIARYIPSDNRDANDFSIRLRFKSRRKKADGPADIVLKIADVDPALSCVPLQIAKHYVNSTKEKFELDIHGENGRLRMKSALSYTIDLPLEFDQTSPISISSMFPNVAAKTTYSERPLMIVPDSAGRIVMQTAEFNLNLAGEKTEATIFYFKRETQIKAEFSYKVKGDKINRDTLVLAQQLVAQLSQIQSIASFASEETED